MAADTLPGRRYRSLLDRELAGETPHAAPLLLSQTEAAKLLGVSPRRLRDLTAPRGPIPVVPNGRRPLYDPDDLRAWVTSAKRRTVAAPPDDADRPQT